jgi:hypothetical protein
MLCVTATRMGLFPVHPRLTELREQSYWAALVEKYQKKW